MYIYMHMHRNRYPSSIFLLITVGFGSKVMQVLKRCRRISSVHSEIGKRIKVSQQIEMAVIWHTAFLYL